MAGNVLINYEDQDLLTSRVRITIPSNVLNRAAKFTFHQTFKNLNKPRSNIYFETYLFRCQHTTSKTV